MSIGAIASGIFNSVSSSLAASRPKTAGAATAKSTPGTAPTPPNEAGTPDPATRKTLADLQAWITAQQQGTGAGAPNAARVRNAYAATSAAAGPG